MSPYVHRMLNCGVEFAAQVLPERRTVCLEFQILTGIADEPTDQLGVTHLLEQTITKGTEQYDAQGLADAFDHLGASCDSWVGRETCGFRCLCLPEFVDQVLELHAEFLRHPTFPLEPCRIAVALAQQELEAMQDDPMELLRKAMASRAYGDRLGRHVLGTPESVAAITREAIAQRWSDTFCAGRLQVVATGPIDPDVLAGRIDEAFNGFGSVDLLGRDPLAADFSPGVHHQDKQLEQEYIGICWPGAAMTDPDLPVQRVALGVLDGGMSGRLFAEVREKQGLVYWVGAWHEHPRGTGVIHMGASTTPERCDQTLETLLREVDRLSDDIQPEELERAIVGIVARTQTAGDATTARASELADDLFYFGRPIPVEEKLAKVKAVTIDQIVDYLARYPRDAISVITLGPRSLDVSSIA